MIASIRQMTRVVRNTACLRYKESRVFTTHRWPISSPPLTSQIAWCQARSRKNQISLSTTWTQWPGKSRACSSQTPCNPTNLPRLSLAEIASMRDARNRLQSPADPHSSQKWRRLTIQTYQRRWCISKEPWLWKAAVVNLYVEVDSPTHKNQCYRQCPSTTIDQMTQTVTLNATLAQ